MRDTIRSDIMAAQCFCTKETTAAWQVRCARYGQQVNPKAMVTGFIRSLGEDVVVRVRAVMEAERDMGRSLSIPAHEVHNVALVLSASGKTLEELESALVQYLAKRLAKQEFDKIFCTPGAN